MIRMTVAAMLAATDAELVCGDARVEFTGVSLDSRSVPVGGAFVAFVGERVDGNKFCAQALREGAAVVVATAEADEQAIEAARSTGGCVVRAKDDDGERFMLALATAWRDLNPQWLVVGVTGSVGKTTTKELLAAGLAAWKPAHATEGNHNNLLGVPLTLFAAGPEAQVLVVEMGMNNAGEIARLAACARPCVGVITNVGTSHMGNLGSREGIARAKAEIVGGLVGAQGVGPALVLTDDDDYTEFIAREFAEPAGVTVLRAHGRDLSLEAAELTENGAAHVRVRFADGCRLEGTLSMPGIAPARDLVSALLAADALGAPRERAFSAMCAARGAHMRLEVRKEPGSARVIDDSYNASPASMASALDVLCSLPCAGRRIAVLGEMGELGEAASRLHALVGAYAAAKHPDLLVCVGNELAHAMAEAACVMGLSPQRVLLLSDAAEATLVLGPTLAEDDLVLVKASRAARLDLFAQEVCTPCSVCS